MSQWTVHKTIKPIWLDYVYIKQVNEMYAKLFSLLRLIMGNRTSCRPILSVIITVIKVVRGYFRERRCYFLNRFLGIETLTDFSDFW